MRAPFQAGDFPAPVKYGYASVGRSSTVRASSQDRDVFVLYPHQTRYVVPAAAVHVLPDGVPPAGRCWPPISKRRSTASGTPRPHIGDRVDGDRRRHRRLSGRLAGRPHRRLRRPARRHQSARAPRSPRALGVAFAAPATASDGGRCRDPRQRLAGRPAARARVAGVEATITELSWYGDREVPLRSAGRSTRGG